MAKNHKLKANKAFNKLSLNRQKVISAIIIVFVAGLGVYLLGGGHAASPFVSSEAESGTLAGGAAAVSDSNASGGNAVKFNGVSSGGGPAFATAISADGHYMVDQNGNPFLVNGDTPWALPYDLDSTDQTTYLQDRQKNGFNSVWVDLVGSNTIASDNHGTNWNGEVPFTNDNIATPNATYWSRIDTFFTLCKQYGISVFAEPMDSYAVAGELFNSVTTTQATNYGSFLANRYPQSQYPGIIWAFGNDWAGDGVGDGNSTPSPSIYKALLTGLDSTGGTRPTIAELGYNESLDTDGKTFGPTMTLNGVYDYHPTYEGIIRARAAKDEPAIHIEGVYENTLTSHPDAPLDVRKQPLWTFTSGGAGQFYGNDALWQFNSGWQNQLDTSGVAQRKAFMSAISATKWWTLQPDTSNQLVTAGRNTPYTAYSNTSASPETDDSTYGNYVSAAYSSDGSLAVIYNPDTTVNTSITVSSSVLGANPTITRVDPTTGATTNLGWTTHPTGGANTGGAHDWLFIINATAK